MAQHARLDLTIDQRLINLELDMTAVHEAIDRLAQRLDELTDLVEQRDKSHYDAVQVQIDRLDTLTARLRDEPVSTGGHQAPETTANGLLDAVPEVPSTTPQAHY